MRPLPGEELEHLRLISQTQRAFYDCNSGNITCDWKREFKIWAETLHEFIQYLENRMLLFPDLTKKQHEAEHFVFAYPCSSTEWHKLFDHARRTKTPKEYYPYVFIDDRDERIAIILRPQMGTDEECLTTAAYLRMVKEHTGMIYALPFNLNFDEDYSFGAIIARTAGVDPKKVRHVEVSKCT